MSFLLSFHLPLLGPTGAHWLDDLSDVSCKDSTRQHPADGSPLSCNQLPCQERPIPARLSGSLGGSPPAATRQNSGGLAGFDPCPELHRQHSGALRGRGAPAYGSGGWACLLALHEQSCTGTVKKDHRRVDQLGLVGQSWRNSASSVLSSSGESVIAWAIARPSTRLL
jgi:hypothetical protein